MCGAQYDMTALSAVVSEPLHKQLLMIRDPLSSVYKNKTTAKSFKCSALALLKQWQNGQWSSKEGGPSPSAVPSPTYQPCLLHFIAASLAVWSSSFNC